MSEEPPIPSNDDENLPPAPEDISELVDDLHDREAQRRKALRILLARAEAAETQDEREHWMLKAMEFGDILDEFRDQFPELFR